MATYKTLNGVDFSSLHYRIEGKGDAIVLLHGFPLDNTIWDDAITALSKQYKVIAPDLPGSGKSTNEDADLTVEKMAKAISEILKNESTERAVIVGHSMGGYVALAFHDIYPEISAGIAMVHSLATADSDEKKEQRRKAIDLINKGGKEPFVKQMIPNLFPKVNNKVPPEVIIWLTAVALETSADNLVAFYNAMIMRPDRTSNLYNSNVPYCWMIGRDDQIMSYNSILQHSTLTNVNFVYVYDECGHMSMIEYTDTFVRDLEDFVRYCFNRVE